jgi:GT2 family glycosyltransferase
MGPVRISVVIPTKDRPQDLAKCLGSIFNQTLLPDEIVIVDCSTQKQLNSSIVAEANEKVKTIYLHTAPGLTYQRNRGIEASSGDILLFLDDDIVLDKNFVKEIVNVFENDREQKVAGVYGNIVSPEKQHDLSLRQVLVWVIQAVNRLIAAVFFLSQNGNGRFRASGFPTYVHGAKETKRVECLPGGLTAYRREVFAEFKFDENLHGYAYMEDDDFSYRLSRKYENVFTPYAKAFHNVSPASRIGSAARERMLIENSHYLFKKNLPPTLKHKLAYYWAVLGLGLGAAISSITGRDPGILKGFVVGLAIIMTPRRRRSAL